MFINLQSHMNNTFLKWLLWCVQCVVETFIKLFIKPVQCLEIVGSKIRKWFINTIYGSILVDFPSISQLMFSLKLILLVYI